MIAGEELRNTLLHEFASPRFLGDALKTIESMGVSYASAYYAFRQLVEKRQLIQVDRAQHPGNHRTLFRFVDPSVQVKVAAAPTSMVTPASGSASGLHHRKPNTAVKAPAKQRIQEAPTQPLTSPWQLPGNNQPRFVELCSTLAHYLLDVDLGVRNLSQQDLTAMRRLAKIMQEKTAERHELEPSPEASALPLSSAWQLLVNNQPRFVELCSTLAHYLLDVDLGVRNLSQQDLTAMCRLAKIMQEKVNDHRASDDPAMRVSLIDAPYQQSA